ncbi:MAG: DUF1223 domain-containing protein [Pseudomonadota bacterium]
MNMTTCRPLSLACLLVLLTTAAAADDTVTFESPDHQTRIVELYTSEGCSSCPPADRWLTALREDEGLWTDFIPLAFHVTYWNYLGWRDEFSDEAFDQRQRRKAARAGSGVYTPGVFLDGDEYRRWRRRPGAPEARTEQDAGRLTVNIEDGRVEARFTGGKRTPPSHLEFAILASGLSSNVRAGENRGRRLQHDFVVADLSRHALTRSDDGWQVSFDLPSTDLASDPAIAAWVVDKRGAPLQATGGWL